MDFEVPGYERSLVDAAGEAILGYADALERFEQLDIQPADVIDNWRAAHAYPLNTFQMALRSRAKKVDPQALVAQRSKRARSIREKLSRYPLTLSEIQDIAGCRAILSSVAQVYKLADLYRVGYSDHILDCTNDYIRKPKSDGYRSYHLVYRYTDAKHPLYQDLKVEIQIRSQLQHCWATAVETVDIFLKEGLKAHRGSPEWKRFFALMGSAIALEEGCRVAPRTPKNQHDLRAELRQLDIALGVKPKLHAFGETLNVVGEEYTRKRRIRYIILALDTKVNPPTMNLYGYGAAQVEAANEHYTELEGEGKDAVLVSVSDAAGLRNAYPNYFLDTRFFVGWMEQFIQAGS